MRSLATRRAALATIAIAPWAGLLSACGFTPLYAPSGGGAGPASEGLAEITVDLIPERPGQLLRQALQARFYGSGSSRPRLMELKASFALSSDSIAIQPDNSSTRARVTGTCAWTLLASDPKLGTLTSGTTRVVDGYNVFDQQFFAADQSNDTVQRRIAEATADRITQQLAIYFRKRAAT